MIEQEKYKATVSLREAELDAAKANLVKMERDYKRQVSLSDGNATLVDDFGGNKQLITVTTKNGNYFYILIDRDDEGEDTYSNFISRTQKGTQII